MKTNLRKFAGITLMLAMIFTLFTTFGTMTVSAAIADAIAASVTGGVSGNIEGIQGVEIEPLEVTLTASVSGSTNGFKAIAAGTTVNTWFENLPAGLNAKVKTALTAAGTGLTITISGKPTGNTAGVQKTDLAIKVPKSALDESTAADTGTITATGTLPKYTIDKPTTTSISVATADAVTANEKEGVAIVTPILVTLTANTNSAGFAVATASGSDVTEWIKNIPAGLKAELNADVADNASTMTIKITGTPGEGKTGAMDIVVPADALYNGDVNGKEIKVSASKAQWNIIPAVSKITVSNATVTGSANVTIKNVDITLTTDGSGFYNNTNALDANASVKGWFSNIPEGLDAKVKKTVKDGDKTIIITISGKPDKTKTTDEIIEAMQILVPNSALIGDANVDDVTVTPNANTKWNIQPVTTEIAMSNVTVWGAKDSQITQKEITLTALNGAGFGKLEKDKVIGTDPAWVLTGIPAGLAVKVKSTVPEGSKTVTLIISGTPTAVADETAIGIKVLGTSLLGGETPANDCTVDDNDKAICNIEAVTTSADLSVADVTIKGFVNKAITEQKIIITAEKGAGFAKIAAGKNVTSWFDATTIPKGLKATVKDAVEAGSKTLVITISGTTKTPTAAEGAEETGKTMSINAIPSEFMYGAASGGSAVSVLSNTDAKFDIQTTAMNAEKTFVPVDENVTIISKADSIVGTFNITPANGGKITNYALTSTDEDEAKWEGNEKFKFTDPTKGTLRTNGVVEEAGTYKIEVTATETYTDNDGTSKTKTVVVFAEVKIDGRYSATFSNPDNGKLTAAVGSEFYKSETVKLKYGDKLTLTVEPAAGYKVKSWTITTSDSKELTQSGGSTYDFTVTDNYGNIEVAVEMQLKPTVDPANKPTSNVVVTGSYKIGDDKMEAAYLDLIAEELVIPTEFSVASYSTDGGKTWKAATKGFDNATLEKLINKELTLALSNEVMDKKTKKFSSEADVIYFDKIQARPKLDKPTVSYTAIDVGSNPISKWTLVSKGANTPYTAASLQVAPMDGKTIGTYSEFNTTAGKDVLPFDSGVKKEDYAVRIIASEKDGKYTPASKYTKVSVMAQQAAPKYKVSKGAVSYKAGTWIAEGSAEAVLKNGKGSFTSEKEVTISAWMAATAKKPASAKQTGLVVAP